MSQVDSGFSPVHILFSKKNIGYLSIRSALDNYYIIYKTTDRGHSWNIILNTKNLPLTHSTIQKIRVTNQNIYLIIFFKIHGGAESIVSNDSGKSWTYKINNKEAIKTFDGGLTWEAVKNKK